MSEIRNVKEEKQIKQALLNEILFKEQFMLKLGIVYLLGSLPSILWFLILYSAEVEFTNFITYYVIGLLVFYKFFFKANHNGGHFKVFLFKILTIINKKMIDITRKKYEFKH